MKTENWQQIKVVFHGAVELPPGERAQYLDRVCSGQGELRSEVESLLRSYQEAGDLLEEPALRLEQSPLSSVDDDPWVGNYIGPYQVISRIGRGGMGAVYRAVRVDDHYLKQVAIKVVRAGLNNQLYLRRFRNERQIMASLDHPNIARLLDGGTTEDGRPYFVMEFIEGQRIDHYCDEHKLSTHDRLQLFCDVCSAVEYAHQHLVVHRDLKPGNILVTKECVPKLLDFGIAKLLEPELFFETLDEDTAASLKPMTPEYASPEQIRSEPITTSSDVYSLGVLLYRLLTGHSPYPGECRSRYEVARNVTDTEPQRPSLVIGRCGEVNRGDGERVTLTPELVSSTRDGNPQLLRRRLSGDLDNIVLKALRKEPAQRYASVEQLSEDIRRHMKGMPVSARKDTVSYRTGKFISRHRGGVVASALIFLVMLGGVLVISRQAHIARVQKEIAERRSNDIRKLSEALIFELDDSIRDIPGATAARKLLVNNAVQYLDELAREGSGDPSPQRELAIAYQKLGDVQGNPVLPNIGDGNGAVESYRKAVAIHEALAAADPANQEEQYALAISHRLLGFLLLTREDLPGALENARRALAAVEPMAKGPDSDRQIFDELGNVYKLLGDIEGGNGPTANLADISSALEHHRKAMEIAVESAKKHPEDADIRMALAGLDVRIGDDLLKSGNRADALPSYQKGLATFQGLAASSAKTMYSRGTAAIQMRIADALATDGDTVGALALYRSAAGLAEQMVALDPGNALARTDLAESYAAAGRAFADVGNLKQGLFFMEKATSLARKDSGPDPQFVEGGRTRAFIDVRNAQLMSKAGRDEAALASFRSALAFYDAVSTVDTRDAGAQICAAAIGLEIGRILAKRGDLDGALRVYENALKVGEQFTSSNRFNVQALYTAADAHAAIAEAYARKASAVGLPAAQRVEWWARSGEHYQQSAYVWQRIQTPGKMGPEGFYASDPKKVGDGLRIAQAALARLKPDISVALH